jgi:hypothetical protein
MSVYQFDNGLDAEGATLLNRLNAIPGMRRRCSPRGHGTITMVFVPNTYKGFGHDDDDEIPALEAINTSS